MNPALDEQLHPGDGEPGREEMYRFAWIDHGQKLCGATWIRFRIDRRQIDAAFLGVQHGHLKNLHLVSADRMNRTIERFQPQFGLPAGQMSMCMLQPWKHWEVTLLGRNHAHLDWQRTAGRVHGEYASEPNATYQWTDQLGTVVGYTMFRRKETEIKTSCLRQHDWGVPPWRRKTGWQRWSVGCDDGTLLSWHTETTGYGSDFTVFTARQGRRRKLVGQLHMQENQTILTLGDAPSVILRQVATVPWVREGSLGELRWFTTGQSGFAFCETMDYTGRTGYLREWKKFAAAAGGYFDKL